MTKIAGSESGSISQGHGSANSDQDPHQNVMDLQHWFVIFHCFWGKSVKLNYMKKTRVSEPDPRGTALFLKAGSGSALESKFSGGPCTLKMEVRRVLDQWSQIRITLMRSRIRIHIDVKSWIRIRI